MRSPAAHSLEQDDIYELSKHEPRVEFIRHSFPPVSLGTELGLQFAFPPDRPSRWLTSILRCSSVENTPRPQLSNDPFPFRLPPEHPPQTRIIRSAPKRKLQEEEDLTRSTWSEEVIDDRLGDECEESQLGERGCEERGAERVEKVVRGWSKEDVS